jgi:hypothetical protein
MDLDGSAAVVGVVLDLAAHALDERRRLLGAGESDSSRASCSHLWFPFSIAGLNRQDAKHAKENLYYKYYNLNVFTSFSIWREAAACR